MIHHRGKEFVEIMAGIIASLKDVFQTKGDVLVLTGSGTGGMEAAVVNVLSPGDTVLVASCGVFGDRFAEVAKQFGADVVKLDFDWGRPVDPYALRRALKANPQVKLIFVTHNETSTGITNDMVAISGAVKEADKLLVVDAISSLGCIDLPVDKLGCDIVISASQKGWLIPPGLAMISVSEAAWQAIGRAKMPRYYWDFKRARDFSEKALTPWTPAVSLFYALAAGLELMLQEGVTNIFARHSRVAGMVRNGIKSLGLTLFAEEAYASNTVTAVRVPDGVNAKKLLQVLRDEHEIVLAGGPSRLEGKIFRIGHLGWVEEEDMQEVLDGLKATLSRMI
jgi:aspartate aminotransferase-like enzyme